jgi:hypothetical protein
MHLTAPSHWSRSIGTGGRDPSERVVTIVGMRMYRRHDLNTGFGTERDNLAPDAKGNDKWPTP